MNESNINKFKDKTFSIIRQYLCNGDWCSFKIRYKLVVISC